MKQFVLVFILVLGNTGFSQRIDSLQVSYYVGCDCSYVIDSMELRGACENRSEIRYARKKRSYRKKSFVSTQKFREWRGDWESNVDSITGKKTRNWNGGFGPNLIVDSVENYKSSKKQRLSANKLDEFLQNICAIHTDSIFSYAIKEIPVSFLRSNDLTKESSVSEIDSVMKKPFSYAIVSSVVGRLHIRFCYKGKAYSLSKGLFNPQWYLTYSVGEKDESVEFIYFAFDAFLLNELPKNFSGIKVLD